MELKRAISVTEMYNMSFPIMEFKGEFKATFGQPQLGGSWLVWGGSGAGKTSLSMQLCKYLTQFGKVLYNSYEEGVSMSFKNTIMRNKMQDVSGKFSILDGEYIKELTYRLARKNSPKIVIMDSVQHALLTKEQYKDLRVKFPKKLFIYISHESNKLPKGEVADFIRYDADLKIRVEGFKAFADGRLNKADGVPFDIYPEKSKYYWKDKV